MGDHQVRLVSEQDHRDDALRVDERGLQRLPRPRHGPAHGQALLRKDDQVGDPHRQNIPKHLGALKKFARAGIRTQYILFILPGVLLTCENLRIRNNFIFIRMLKYLSYFLLL